LNRLDEDLLALEFQEIQEADFDLCLTGFDIGEIDKLLTINDEERANAIPPLLSEPVSRRGGFWMLRPARLLAATAPTPKLSPV